MTKLRRILIIDDSAYSRRALKQMLEELLGDVECVYAGTGEEGLQSALESPPDLIFLDLELPRMDGYTVLRLLMNKQPTPVIIVSGHDDHGNVLKALELGALDFIAKPTRQTSTRIYEIRNQLQEKLALVDAARPARSDPALTHTPMPMPIHGKPAPDIFTPPSHLVCIGASTGGPGTISMILDRIQLKPWATIVIAQHMPERFTTAFAERLDRHLPFRVAEIRHLDRIEAGVVYICPGGQNTVVSAGRDLRFRLVPPRQEDRYVPSVDALFTSAASQFGQRCLGVVLTGMGNDGTMGGRAIRNEGGTLIAENPKSAIVFGMPSSLIEANLAHFVYDAEAIAGAIEQWLLGILQRK